MSTPKVSITLRELTAILERTPLLLAFGIVRIRRLTGIRTTTYFTVVPLTQAEEPDNHLVHRVTALEEIAKNPDYHKEGYDIEVQLDPRTLLTVLSTLSTLRPPSTNLSHTQAHDLTKEFLVSHLTYAIRDSFPELPNLDVLTLLTDPTTRLPDTLRLLASRERFNRDCTIDRMITVLERFRRHVDWVTVTTDPQEVALHLSSLESSYDNAIQEDLDRVRRLYASLQLG